MNKALIARTLRLVSIALLLGAMLFWTLKGSNTGWTKTSVPVKIVDDVTGLEGISYEAGFVPGMELLGVAVAASVGLFGLSFFFKKQKHPTHL